jgi:hypothetical protein
MSPQLFRATVVATCLSVCATIAPKASADDASAPLRPSVFKLPDSAVTSKRLSAAVTWQNDTLVKAYDRVGHRDPKWNEAVHTGLGFIARASALDPGRPVDASDQARVWLRKAVNLGCQDALVNFLLAELSQSDVSRKESADRIRSTALRLETSQYPIYRRGLALVEAASALLDSGRGMAQKDWVPLWTEICRLDEGGLALLGDIAKDPTISDELLIGYVNELVDTWAEASRRDRHIAFDPSLAAIKSARGADAPVVSLLRGWFFVSYAWDARGTGPASAVKPEVLSAFYDRLDEAQASVGQAAAGGSTSPAIPAIMRRICTARGRANDHIDLDDWFKAGITVDPGDRDLQSAYEQFQKRVTPAGRLE